MVFREQLEEMYKEMYDEAKAKNTSLGCIPLKLNESNVYKIFKKCLANGTTKNKISTKIFFKGLSGISSTEILFDKDKISEYSGGIKYMLGQISAIHNSALKNSDNIKTYVSDIPYVKLEDVMICYTGEQWTNDQQYLYKLLYLGNTIGNTSPVITHHSKLYVHFIDMTPTLSPDDPNFKEWYSKLPSE